MNEEIKPCPFCGGLNIELSISGSKDREGVPANLYCDDCGSSGPWDYINEENLTSGRERLLKIWNKRA